MTKFCSDCGKNLGLFSSKKRVEVDGVTKLLCKECNELNLQRLIQLKNPNGAAHNIVSTSNMELPRHAEVLNAETPEVIGKHKKQVGGRGEFAACLITMKPLPLPISNEIEFVVRIKEGTIPKNWISVIERAVRERLYKGGSQGYPIINVQVTLRDGKYHEVDSSDAAFEQAATQAVEAALKEITTTVVPYPKEIK